SIRSLSGRSAGIVPAYMVASSTASCALSGSRRRRPLPCGIDLLEQIAHPPSERLFAGGHHQEVAPSGLVDQVLERFPYPLDLFGEIVDDNDRRSFDRGRTLEDREGDSCRLATTDVGDDRAVPTGLARQLCGQPSPPHARRPNEEHRTAMPVARASPRPAEPPKLVLPANERAHQIELRREFGLSSTVGRAWRDDRCCVCRGHASRTYRFADPLQLEGFRRLEGQP